MNYRHAFHAGNFADVLKHAVLARVLVHLSKKDAAFRVIDTHAGVGLYDLASDEALRTGEWRGGIGRVMRASLGPALADFLEPLRTVLRAVNGGDDLLVYPGSPTVAATLGRRQDRFVFNELHPQDADELAARFAADRRVKVTRQDGYTAARSLLPPHERRGLTVIDPPFEEAGEFDRMLQALKDADRRFATGTIIAWYPLKHLDAVQRFHADVAESGLTKVLRLDQWVRRPGGIGPLAGAGLLVVNPPWTLKAEAEAALPDLTERLADGPGAGFRADWLVPETHTP
ncbi:23S rRNA (adenine(2030)-N(6))-methyltransferase RlmJ [Chthonobacter rhizosphaerae]|uniref:23S rRNA (adenine(2030)-N(6))-methyltransferase RlmJ n=1 Tax=Chthonobacter rhizosphaerae TaxID=2735553 RepID=UPI0015EF0B36|nr:23S rRNA (adenine(2030)-N(6))-methyltransferase RlmJ [Chthonobacter rhizosphaerae]